MGGTQKVKEFNLNKREKLLVSMVVTLIIVMAGITMNFVAIDKNNCKMPVLSNYELNSENHFSFQDKNEVNFFYFSDILNFPENHYFSIGDVFVCFGLLAFIIQTLFFAFKRWEFDK